MKYILPPGGWGRMHPTSNTRKLHSTSILLYRDGDTYTGLWIDGSNGQGEINYKDGKKYKGHWDADWDDDYKLKRYGLGTLYSVDGQVLSEGKWEWNEYKGKK